MTQPNEPPPEIDIGMNAAPTVEIGKVFKNTRDNILMITTSKAELVLREHWKNIQQSNDWQTTILFLIPMALALPTNNFDDRFGISGYVWEIFFLAVVCVGTLWLAVQGIRHCLGRVMNAKKVVDLLLEDGEQITPASSSAPAASDTAQTEQAPSPDDATPPSTADPAHIDGHPSLSSPSQPSAPQQDLPSAEKLAGAAEPSSPPEAAPNGVRPDKRVPELLVGAHVQHRNYGDGTVVKVLPGPPRWLLVKFADPDVGTKRLREDLAPLWHLGSEE